MPRPCVPPTKKWCGEQSQRFLGRLPNLQDPLLLPGTSLLEGVHLCTLSQCSNHCYTTIKMDGFQWDLHTKHIELPKLAMVLQVAFLSCTGMLTVTRGSLYNINLKLNACFVPQSELLEYTFAVQFPLLLKMYRSTQKLPMDVVTCMPSTVSKTLTWVFRVGVLQKALNYTNRGRACDVIDRQFLHTSTYFHICAAILRGNK